MRPLVGPFRSPWLRLAVLIAAPILVSGCSSDSTRFTDGAFSNPFRSSNDVTGSVPAQRSNTPAVESRPLPPQQAYQPQPSYQQASYTPPAPPATKPAHVNARVSSYSPANAPTGDVTGTVRDSNWQTQGGSTIQARQGDTLTTLASRYGVPASAIAQANGLPISAHIYPGQRLVIPVYNNAAAPVAQNPAPAPAPAAHATVNTARHRTAPVPSADGQIHVIKPGETLMALSRRYGKSLSAIAAANNLSTTYKTRIGDRIVIPGGASVAQRAPAPARVAAAAPRATQSVPQPQPEPQRTASLAPVATTATARIATPAPEAEKETTNSVSDPNGSTAEFRWPARGRIIAAFGPKPTGQQNDGINLALPEGTPVKAADDGVVAYAGNELKGYGNLVLVRHDNGYVTAYAHASELLVKRGDKIKRGQVILKSGQTGNVTSPQLHFEIRKGASPLDPLQHLPKA
jgi:murein DD-endopeptidase MepM/ murein hydrolase activator NlpD